MSALTERVCARCGAAPPYGPRAKYCEPCRGRAQREINQAAQRTPAGQDGRRKAYLKYQYDITPEDYGALLAEQGGVCAICKKRPGKTRLAVEHDHRTRRITGLLCANCNHRILGHHGRNPDLYQAAADYLRDPPGFRVLPPGHRTPR